MSRSSTLETIYQTNSDINRITGQLKQVNQNAMDYEQPLTLTHAYADQLAAKAEKLALISKALKVYNAE